MDEFIEENVRACRIYTQEKKGSTLVGDKGNIKKTDKDELI
jgi:hypothetical protein